MNDIRLTQINNIILGVTDLARSSAFYRETLGLEMQFESDGFVFLDAGGVVLALSTAHARLATPPAGATEVVLGGGRRHRRAPGAERARCGVPQRAPQRHR